MLENEGAAARLRLSVLDTRYLKLDASNDPITGDLDMAPILSLQPIRLVI